MSVSEVIPAFFSSKRLHVLTLKNKGGRLEVAGIATLKYVEQLF
jgi:hypothetical protein